MDVDGRRKRSNKVTHFLNVAASSPSLSTPVSADVAPKTVVANENETVTLPCRTNQTSDLLTVEWSKAEMTPNITLLYRHGFETVEEKNSAFLNRTSFILEEVKLGNISQVISKLRLSDGGRYLCRTMVGKQQQVEAVLDLIVGRSSPLWLLGESL